MFLLLLARIYIYAATCKAAITEAPSYFWSSGIGTCTTRQHSVESIPTTCNLHPVVTGEQQVSLRRPRFFPYCNVISFSSFIFTFRTLFTTGLYNNTNRNHSPKSNLNVLTFKQLFFGP